MFSRKICEIFKNNYFEEYLRRTASVVSFSWISLQHVYFLFRIKLKGLKNAGQKIFIIANLN